MSCEGDIIRNNYAEKLNFLKIAFLIWDPLLEPLPAYCSTQQSSNNVAKKCVLAQYTLR